MKTTFSILAAFLASAVFLHAATNDITALLQKGLFEEEANHNLDAALRQYQAAVDGYDQDRQLAATAVFRLGECYRKLGKTNEADVQYQRILRDFADQTTLANLSREYLGGKVSSVPGGELAGAPATSAEDEEVRKIREMIRNSPDLINTVMSGTDINPLQSAVVNGNVAAAELLLANGADVNTFGGNGRTPLYMAADRGNKAMVELLLAKGADVNTGEKSDQRRTPLHGAVEKGFKSVAEVIIAHKANVNARDKDGNTPLHLACSRGFAELAELLIQHGADVNVKNNYGDTPLFTAVTANQPALVQLLLSKNADIKATNSIGQTPLFRAGNSDRLELARLLLNANADVNHRDNSGNTPLIDAARNDQTEVLRLLLTDKADVNATNNEGISPLFYAVAGRHDIALVKALLGDGATTGPFNGAKIIPFSSEPNRPRFPGEPQPVTLYPGMYPLDAAISAGRPDMMEALLAAHADPNARFAYDEPGYPPVDDTPLDWVLHDSAPQAAKEIGTLLDHGANPNLTDKNGRTPLSLAVSGNYLEVVQLLLDHRADPNKPDDGGRPPLGFAATEEIRAMLLKAGANADYERLAAIYISQRGTGSLGQSAFYKGTNTVNHFSLLEALARTSENGYSPVPFPDFAHVIINRLKPGGAKQEIPVNLEEILASGDCSKDVPLAWGDVIQIPQKDHLLNEGTAPLPESYKDTLRKCLERHVEIIVKGQSTKLTLLPNITDNGMLPQAHGTTLYTFWLDEVVHQANVLLLSSDLSRVKVTRHGLDVVYDLTSLGGAGFGGGGRRAGRGGGGFSGPPVGNLPGFGGGGGGVAGFGRGPSTDLWLEDGDVIEIPDRDPNAPNPAK